ncbi:MAG TPA: MFS transporter [Micromonosporaceae bacterium]
MRRRAGFTGLMVAEVISLMGSRMTMVALPWLVLVTTGSATRTGLVAFAEMLPYVIASAIGGPLIDHLGPRRTTIAMDVASLVAVGAIPILLRLAGLHFTLLLVLIAAAGAMRGLSDTAKRALFALVVADAKVNLTRATAVHDGLSRLATLIGAPAAGVLVAATDPATALIVDAVSFGVAAAFIGIVVRGHPATPAPAPAPAGQAGPGEDATPPKESYLRQLRAGVVFVRRDRLMLNVMVMLFITNLIDQAYASVLVPVWAKELLGSPAGLGLVSGALAGGAVLGNLAYTVLAPRLPRYAPFVAGFIVAGSPRFLTLALDSPLWTVLSVSFVAGIGVSVINPILGTVYYERVPQHLQARVQGLSTALAWAGIPVGSLVGGWLVDHTNLRFTLLVAAAGYGVATLLPLTSRVWRGLDRPAPAVEITAAATGTSSSAGPAATAGSPATANRPPTAGSPATEARAQ